MDVSEIKHIRDILYANCWEDTWRRGLIFFFLSYLVVLVLMGPNKFGTILVLSLKYYQSFEALAHCEVATALHTPL